MKLATREPKVVLVYENVEDISGASQIIASLGEEYRAIAFDNTTSDFVIRIKPAVLLFALSSVDKVIKFYTQLIEEKQLSHPHYTILLCNNRDSNAAFHCCVKGVFDDYFVYQPLYEKLRLIMIVQHGLLLCGVKNVTTEFSTDVVEPIDDSREQLIAVARACKRQYLSGQTPMNNPSNGDLSPLPNLDPARQNSASPIDDETAANEILPEFSDFAGDDDLDLPITPHEISDEMKGGKRILVVEDNPIYRDMLVGVLKRAKYEVDEARDGLVALSKVTDNEYDLILMDLFMPKLDGLNTTKQLRGISKRKDTPIVALTGNTNKELIRKWASYGLKGYLIKPSNNNEILACVSRIVKQKDPSPA